VAPPVVKVESLSFSYDQLAILSNVSFTIEQGEWIGLIGPNGGGKTTLLKILLGFLRFQYGKLELFGEPPSEARHRIGYVPQSLGFDPKFPISALELVLTSRLSRLPWYGRYRRADRQAAMEALDRVGLATWANAPFSQLSGGQRQRVLLARALATEPDLLLLDEFTANLDAESEASIYQFLQSLRKQVTLVMVTHDLQAVINYVDRVFSVKQSVVVLRPQEVCEHFAYGVYHPPLLTPGTPK
jgi:zinc transport system ATP-binding protein